MGSDSIDFLGADITSDQLWFSHVGNNLEINILGTADKSIVQDWYLGASHQIEQIKTANGKMLLNTDVEKLVQAMATLSPLGAGQVTLPVDYQAVLNPLLAVNWRDV